MPNSKQNPLLNYRTLTDEERFQNQQNKINAKYDSQLNNLNLGKTTSQQQADITRSQLQKYLPYYYKSRGLSGLGLEQSAMLDANANYTNQLGQIENNFAQQKNALENYRQDDLMKAENDYLARIDNNSLSAYGEVTDLLEGYKFDDKLTDDEYNKVKNTLELYRDTMTPNDIKAAENLLENYRVNYGQKKAEGNTVPNVSDNSFVLTDDIKEGNQEVFLNGEPIFINGVSDVKTNNKVDIPNGTKSKYQKNGKWQEMVYMDGEWYDVKQDSVNEAQRRLFDQMNSADFEAKFNRMNDYQKQEYISTLRKTLTKNQMESIPEYIKIHI